MALITDGLVRLYIIHGLKIMLALLGLRPIYFSKRKKRKKRKPFQMVANGRLSRFLRKKWL
jgi:hypothetical protein